MQTLGKTLMALSTVASFGVAATAWSSTAHAAVFNYYNTNVEVNGTVVSQPGHTEEKDPFGTAITSFLPIWYVDEALGKFDVTANWNGTTGIMNLTTPKGMTVNYPSAPKTMTITPGVMEIQVNGKTVTYAPRLVTYDSGTVDQTTFVPVYYIIKSLGYMGVQASWNGTTWNMVDKDVTVTPPTTPPPTSTGSTPKLDAAVAFAKEIGLQPVDSSSDPYSDVPSADAGYVNALTQTYISAKDNNYGSQPVFNADSSSKFGSADKISVSDLANAFAAYCGIVSKEYSYLPGQSTVGLASALGLLSGLPTSGDLSSSQVSTFMSNLAAVNKGYVSLGNDTYRLVYKPDAFGRNYATGSMPASTYSQDWANAIKVTDATTVQYTGGEYITTTSDTNDAGYKSTSGNYLDIQGGIPGQQYSLNGGSTWQTANGLYGFDSLYPSDGGTSSNVPSQVKLKSNQAGGVIVAYDYNGTVITFTNTGFAIRNGVPTVVSE
ncbi:hypothetical protein [Alicyclobacillus fodiniaquatilis]|uniref:Copper amine oxidase-like N-terminal domain-containing protein n=1 Tax=Alicyclobacillus fodiniaquatilis TaxID=1661150 RepID=A0ABW4JD46_9BACL